MIGEAVGMVLPRILQAAEVGVWMWSRVQEKKEEQKIRDIYICLLGCPYSNTGRAAGVNSQGKGFRSFAGGLLYHQSGTAVAITLFTLERAFVPCM